MAGWEALVHRRHALSAWKSMKACMRRELILMSRHRFVYFFRIAQVLSPFITCLGRQYCLILFFLVPSRGSRTEPRMLASLPCITGKCTKVGLYSPVGMSERRAVCMQLALVAFAAATVFLRVRMPTDTLEDGRKFLAFIFFGIYFMNASAWSELSITVSPLAHLSSPVAVLFVVRFSLVCGSCTEACCVLFTVRVMRGAANHNGTWQDR